MGWEHRKQRDERFVEPDEDLLWLHKQAEAEMGVSAIQYGPSATAVACDVFAAALEPGWVSAPPPTQRCQRAAQRNRWLRGIFRELGGHHMKPLAVAYGHRFSSWALADKTDQQLHRRGTASAQLGTYIVLYRTYGVAAGAVQRCLVAHGFGTEKALRGPALKLAEEAAIRVRRAQEAWTVERLIHRERARRARTEAAAARQERSAAYLAELTGAPQREVWAARARAFLARHGIEVTDNDVAEAVA